jgi:hypothetical protein
MKALIAFLGRRIFDFTLGPQAVIYITLAAFVAGGGSAWWLSKKLHDVEQLEAVSMARLAERDGQALMNAEAAKTHKALEALNARSDRTVRALRAQLRNVPACPIPDAAVRLLDGIDVPGDPGARPGDPAGAPPVAPDPARGGLRPPVDAGAVLENCAWNRVNTCEANAERLKGCIAAYDAIRKRYNGR